MCFGIFFLHFLFFLVFQTLIFTELAPLGRISHRVAMSGCLRVCIIGLSLALRSHDYVQASHWSSPLHPPPPPTFFFNAHPIVFYPIFFGPLPKRFWTGKEQKNMLDTLFNFFWTPLKTRPQKKVCPQFFFT